MVKHKARRPKVRKYSVIVIPDNRAKVWRWEISRHRIEAALATCLIILFTMTGSIWGLVHYRGSYIATADIRLQNAKFEQERSELLAKLANLEQVVQRTERFAANLETGAGLNSGQLQKGIGPLTESEFADPASVAAFKELKFGDTKSRFSFGDIGETIEDMGTLVTTVEDRLHKVYELKKDRQMYSASIPAIWPARGWVTSDFGPRRRPIRGGTSFHKGIDIAAPAGTTILAPGDGVVTFAGYRSGLGKTVIVDHGYGVTTVYGHNSQNYVKEGDKVRRGELLGAIGRTGLATGTHLHYQVEVDGVPVDPMRYIKM